VTPLPSSVRLKEVVSRGFQESSSRPDFGILSLFFILACAVYALAGWMLLKPLLVQAGLRMSPDRPTLKRITLSLAGLGILCFSYGLFFESHWVEVTHIRIPTAKMAPGSPPIRILHLTDTHCDRWGPNEARLLDIVREEKPDLIAFTGDAVNNPGEGVAAFRRLAGALKAPYGCYAVSGNWEVWFWDGLDLFQRTAFEELSGTQRVLDIRGNKVAISGVAYDSPYAEALAAMPRDAFRILLYHTPDLVREPEIQAADLYLAGHTHGGQVCLPLYGAIVTMSKYGKAYESGLYREGACRLYVCRGLGMEGGIAPRVRFCCRPEVAVLELVPEGG
jgi:predicted MPP superfamily phosphohydrolase